MEHIPLEEEKKIETPSSAGETYASAEEFAHAFQDISSDRLYAVGERTQDEIRDTSMLSLDAIPDERRRAALENITLLRYFNGHRGSMLRRVVAGGEHEAAAHCARLREWSAQVGSSEEIYTDALLSDIPELLTDGIASPEELYERLVFAEHHPEATAATYGDAQITALQSALGVDAKKTKWIDFISPTFNGPNREQVFTKLLESIGYIPRELTTKKGFQKVPTASLIASVETLRKMESGKSGEAARYERARLLNAMLAEGNLLSLRDEGGAITLDTNGLFLNIAALHAHIPYGLLEERTLEGLVRDGWLSSESVAEVTLRWKEENNIQTGRTEAEDAQMHEFRAAMLLDDAPLSVIADQVAATPERFAQKLTEEGHILPDALSRELASRGPAGISTLMHIGEAVGETLTNKGLEEWQIRAKDRRSFRTHEMLAGQDKEYVARARVLNDPAYYNAHKALRTSLSHLSDYPDMPEFVTLRGSYKRSREGEQHSFLETLHQGETHRILVNEDKHLQGANKRRFEAVSEFDRDAYRDLERVLAAYSFFRSQLKVLEDYPRSAHDLWARESYRSAAESAQYFLLAHSTPELYRRAEEEYGKLLERYRERLAERENGMGGEAGKEIDFSDTEFLATLHAADQAYRELLYKSITNQTNFIENYMPEVEKRDVAFGPEFAEEAKEKVAPYGYDEDLSREGGQAMRVVQLHYKPNESTHTVPFHIEEAVLDALRIPRGRPFLNVIGGARKIDDEHTSAMDLMSEALVRVAHEHKMNVAVPGTQSGMGLAFGRANRAYLRETEHLPHLEKAHLFSVSPGGNTYYPGNPYLSADRKDHTYAMSPNDQIVTPFGAGWGLRGFDKRNSPYREHVEYMESLYRRLSHRQRRLTVVGNGGLNSIMELTEAYRQGFDVIFIEDVGRLAQVVSAMLSHRDFASFRGELSTDEGCYHAVEEALKRLPDDVAEEFLQKDFGHEAVPENDDHAVYREYFYRMLRVLKEQSVNRIFSVPSEHLEDAVNQYFTVEINNDARYPIREIYIKDKNDVEAFPNDDDNENTGTP